MASLQYKGKHFCGGSLVLIMTIIIIMIYMIIMIMLTQVSPQWVHVNDGDDDTIKIMMTGVSSMGANRGPLSRLPKRWRLPQSSLGSFGEDPFNHHNSLHNKDYQRFFSEGNHHDHNHNHYHHHRHDCNKISREWPTSLTGANQAGLTGLSQR